MPQPIAGALALVAGIATVAAFLSGCTPHIGDKCTLNTDCSIQGTLACDSSEPNGYCTSFGCAPDSCQDRAACVMVGASIPGCPYSDYNSPPRTGRTMCLAQCTKDSDCRTADGYMCVNPNEAPWLHAKIVDDDQQQKVCIVRPDYSESDGGVAAYVAEDGGICAPTGPPVPPIDAGSGIVDAAPGAMSDGGGDSGDAGGDADAGPGTSQGPDAGFDGSSDAAADVGAADGPTGG